MSTDPLPMANLGFQLLPPSPALAPYVRCYWHFYRPTPLVTLQEEYMHPQGGFGIVFNFGDAVHLDGQPLTEPVFLDGVTTVSRYMGFWGRVEQVGMSFHAGGAYPFLALPLGELQNTTDLLAALNGRQWIDLHQRLAEAPTLAAKIALLEGWLMGRLPLGKRRHPLIPSAIHCLRHAQGKLTIADLADHLAIGQRQLERLFHQQVGMTPKQYSQVLRVEAARLALKTADPIPLSSVAVDHGFYDQAHFIREFKAVVGMTPQRYKNRNTISQP